MHSSQPPTPQGGMNFWQKLMHKKVTAGNAPSATTASSSTTSIPSAGVAPVAARTTPTKPTPLPLPLPELDDQDFFRSASPPEMTLTTTRMTPTAAAASAANSTHHLEDEMPPLESPLSSFQSFNSITNSPHVSSKPSGPSMKQSTPLIPILPQMNPLSPFSAANYSSSTTRLTAVKTEPIAAAAMSTSTKRPSAPPAPAFDDSDMVDEPPSYFDDCGEYDSEFLMAAAAADSKASLRGLTSTPTASLTPSSTVANAAAASVTRDRALEFLKRHYGYSAFRPGQFELIEAVAVRRRDAFCLMATGAGKSICFQLLPLLTGKPVIVISPLISLMHDQVLGLLARGIKACALTSDRPDPVVTQAAMEGGYQLVYMSPERLSMSYPQLQALEKKVGIACFAIDESHAISEWGCDFRPEYRNLGQIRRSFSLVPIMALTATATAHVSEDVQKQLALCNPYKVQTTYNRPNLFHEVRMSTTIQKDFTRQLVGDDKVSCIIYTVTKAETEAIASHLRSIGINARAYHASVSPKDRKEIHESFIHDRIRVVVATVAFGMGIDHAETRKIINYGLVKNLESLVQMTGRAGRDGQPAECILFYAKSDYSRAQFLKNGAFGKKGDTGGFALTEEEKRRKTVQTKALDKMQEYVSSNQCRRIAILEYFNENWRMNALPESQSPKGVLSVEGNCKNCDNCLAAARLKEQDQQAASTPGAVRAASINDIDTAHMYYWALAAHETSERFGLAHVRDFLRGSSAKKITEKESWYRVKPLARCVSYGKLKAETPAYVQALGRYLVNLQVLAWFHQGDFQIIKLGPVGKKLLDLGEGGHGTFKPTGNLNLTPELRVEIESRKRNQALKTASREARAVAASLANEATANHNAALLAAAASRGPIDPLEAKLVDSLLDLRTSIAKERNCPPYTIFSRNEIDAFAHHRPTNVEAMSKFAGVTTTKLAQFAPRFARHIEQFTAQHTLTINIPLPIEAQQTTAAPALVGAQGSTFGETLSYVTYLVRHRAIHAGDQVRSRRCEWHRFAPDVVTRLKIAASPNQHVPKTGVREEVWKEFTQGLTVEQIASKRSIKLATAITYLSSAVEAGKAYNWDQFNIPDSAVEEVQAAILKAEAEAFLTGHSEFFEDKHNVGLWSVPYLKHTISQIPGLSDLEAMPPDVRTDVYAPTRLIVNHLRRLYGPSGAVRETRKATAPVTARLEMKESVEEDEDEEEEKEFNVRSEPAKKRDLSQFRSHLASPLKVVTKQAIDRPLSTPLTQPPSTAAAASTTKRSLSDVLTASQPAPTLTPPVTSTLLRPLYQLKSFDQSRALTKQKIKVLELFHSQKTIPQISTQCTLRTGTIFIFLADAILHGYEIDWSRLSIASEDEEAIMKVIPTILPPNAEQFPINQFIPYILQFKKHVLEECSKENILLIVNKYLQQQLHQRELRSVAIETAPTAAVPSSTDAMFVDDIPLEAVPLPINLLSPMDESESLPIPTVTTATATVSGISPLKRKVDTFLATSTDISSTTSADATSKKQKCADGIETIQEEADDELMPCTADSIQSSPASSHNSPQTISQSSVVGNKHVNSTPHPITMLQEPLNVNKSNDAVSETVVEVNPPPSLPLTTDSILQLLRSSALKLEELGERLIPTGTSMWSSLGKLQGLLIELQEDALIMKNPQEQFQLM